MQAWSSTPEDSGQVQLPSSPRDKSIRRLKSTYRFRKNLWYGSVLKGCARAPARQRGSFNFYLHDMGYGGGGGLPVGREDRQSICADPLKNFGDVPKCLLKRAEKYFSFEKPHLCEMSFIGRY